MWGIELRSFLHRQHNELQLCNKTISEGGNNDGKVGIALLPPVYIFFCFSSPGNNSSLVNELVPTVYLLGWLNMPSTTSTPENKMQMTRLSLRHRTLFHPKFRGKKINFSEVELFQTTLPLFRN